MIPAQISQTRRTQQYLILNLTTNVMDGSEKDSLAMNHLDVDLQHSIPALSG